jgi:hypothetical protein
MKLNVLHCSYYVDRRKSVDDLRDFLDTKDQKVEEEAKWLKENHIDCVLSDAAFLAWYGYFS